MSSSHDQQETERPRQRQRLLTASTTTTARRSTRSQARLEAFRSLVSSLPLLIQNGWCTDVDAVRLDCVSRQARLGEEVWSALALQMWPSSSADSDADVPASLPVPSLAPTYRQLFSADIYPRFWLACEMGRIRTLPEWMQPRHLTLCGVIECGRCGCNCRDGDCGGLPMSPDKPRYIRTTGPDWVDELGYMDPNRFCGDCYAFLKKHGALEKAGEYKEVQPTLLEELIVEHVRTGNGYLLSESAGAMNSTFIDHMYSGDRYLWRMAKEKKEQEEEDNDAAAAQPPTLDQILDVVTVEFRKADADAVTIGDIVRSVEAHFGISIEKPTKKKIKAHLTELVMSAQQDDDGIVDDEYPGKHLSLDDVLIVIAHGLIQPGCKMQNLDLSYLGHSSYKDRPFGHKGIKALCLALSINKSLSSIKMFETAYHHVCCPGGEYDYWNDRFELYDPVVDVSRGLLLKAIRHNQKSKLKKLYLCPRAFGIELVRELRQHVEKVENWSEPCW